MKRKRFFSLGLLLMILVICGPYQLLAETGQTGSRVTIILKDQPEAGGEAILLGEVARVQGDDEALIRTLRQIPLGQSPRPGFTLTLTPQIIRYHLTKHHLDPEQVSFSGPDRCLVGRQHREITAGEIEQFFREWFWARFSQREFELERVRVSLPQAIKVANGRIAYEIPLLEQPKQHDETFALRLSRDGELVKQVWISARLRYHTNILTAAKDLKRGQVIAPSEVMVKPVTLNRLEPDQLKDPAQVVGLVCRQPIRAGREMNLKMVEMPLLVKRGDIVKMTVESEGLRVEGLGKAKADGRRGETISAENLTSQETVYGVVTGENQILVTF